MFSRELFIDRVARTSPAATDGEALSAATPQLAANLIYKEVVPMGFLWFPVGFRLFPLGSVWIFYNRKENTENNKKKDTSISVYRMFL